jgi:hypothetical protein
LGKAVVISARAEEEGRSKTETTWRAL